MSEPPSQTQSGSNVGVNTNIPPPGVRPHYQGQGGDQSSFPPSSQASFRGGPPAGLDSGYGGRSSHPPSGLPQVPISTGPRPRMDGPVPSLIPTVPYYDLPAGLMAPLVRLEDCDYTPLNPKDLRLPPPMPPSERLLAAIEAFYTPASHENPRDNEGWERLGLYEYYQAKERAVAEARNRGDVRDKPDKDSDDSDSDGAMAEKKKQEAESSSDSSSEDEKAAPAASSEEDSDDDDDSSDESSSSSSEDDDADDNDDSAGLTEGEKKKKKKEAAKKAKKKAAAKAKKVAKKKAKKAAAKKEKKKLAAAAAKKGGKDKKEKKKKKNKSAAPADEDKKEASGEKKEAATAKQEPSKPEANGTKQEAEKGRTRYTSASPERDPNVQPKEGSHGDGRRRSRSRERGSYKRSRSRSPRQHWQKSRSPSKTPPGPTSAPPIDVVKGNNQHPGGGGTRPGQSTEAPIDHSNKGHQLLRKMAPPIDVVKGNNQHPGGGGTRPGQSTEAPIDHSNKGHQLLRKMGWGGGGLGQHEHGIQEPIKSGEIRDNPSERYRGIGQPEVDPFEQFRKQQAQQFMVTKGASRKKGGPGGGREKR